jgi:hypothetical protein
MMGTAWCCDSTSLAERLVQEAPDLFSSQVDEVEQWQIPSGFEGENGEYISTYISFVTLAD